jgi:serine/threonine-protein kinase
MHLPYAPPTEDAPTRLQLSGPVPRQADPTATIPPGPETAEVPIPRLGRYHLREVLGRGGMAVVWRAWDPELGRDVALKVFPDTPDVAARARFLREAKAAGRLSHPNVVPIHDMGLAGDGRPFLVMGLVAGGTLADRRDAVAGQWRMIAALVEGAARGVEHAHAAGVMHRDIKPTNVLLDAESRPLVADFGLARLREEQAAVTHPGQVIGTPAYMAPEQANGAEVGPAADIWSLGVVLYELLAGRRPFGGPCPALVLEIVRRAMPDAPSRWRRGVPPELEAICLKCLEKDSRRRYASPGELADDLRRFLDGQPIRARRPTLVSRAARSLHRRPALALSVLAVVALAVAVAPRPDEPEPVPGELTPRSVVRELDGGHTLPLVPETVGPHWWAGREGVPGLPRTAKGSPFRLDATGKRALLDVCPHVERAEYGLAGSVRLVGQSETGRAGFYVAARTRTADDGLHQTFFLVTLRDGPDGLELSVGPWRTYAGGKERPPSATQAEFGPAPWSADAGTWHEVHIRAGPDGYGVSVDGRERVTVTFTELADVADVGDALGEKTPATTSEQLSASGAIGVYGSGGVAEFRDVRLVP